MIFFTYGGDCMGFPELVEGSIEEGHSKDESKICEVDKNSSRSPNRTWKLHASRSQGIKEVFQVDPDFRIRIQAKPGLR